MAQIINENPGIGALLGSGLGQGISTGLQQLAQLKANQLLQRQQQRHTASGLQALGFSPQESMQISLLPSDLQGLVIKNYLGAAENAGLDQALQGLSLSQSAPQQAPSESVPLYTQQQQAQLPKQDLAALLGVQSPSILGKQLPSEKVVADLLAKQTAPQKTVGKQLVSKQGAIQEATPQQEQEPGGLANILRRPRLTPEHRLKVEALKQQREIAQQKITAKEQEVINHETKPSYDQIQKEGKAAKDNNLRLDRMEQLIGKGNLDTPGFANLIATLKHGVFGVGIDLSHALTPDSQEFEKLSNDFIKTAKDYFGSRLTDADLKAFLKTIPTLSLTKEGKERVIRNLRLFNDAALVKKKVSDDLVRANGGKRPRDYDQRIEDIASPELDRLAVRFKISG